MAFTEQAAVSVKQLTINSVIENLDPLLGRLEELAGRATNCGDRIHGPRPNGVDAGEKNPSPGNLIGAIQLRRDRLSRAVEALENEIKRIEGGL